MKKTHIIVSEHWGSDADAVTNANTGKIAFRIGESVELLSTAPCDRCSSKVRAIFRRPNGQITHGCFSWLKPINS